jgi:hypothetical protein
LRLFNTIGIYFNKNPNTVIQSLKMRKNTYEISVLTLPVLSIPMPNFDINKANKMIIVTVLLISRIKHLIYIKYAYAEMRYRLTGA